MSFRKQLSVSLFVALSGISILILVVFNSVQIGIPEEDLVELPVGSRHFDQGDIVSKGGVYYLVLGVDQHQGLAVAHLSPTRIFDGIEKHVSKGSSKYDKAKHEQALNEFLTSRNDEFR